MEFVMEFWDAKKYGIHGWIILENGVVLKSKTI